MCPVFPEGVPNPNQKNSYRELTSKNLRFDAILLSMVEQAGQIWQIRTDKFYLHGFSAGGQFVHRFMYLHPDRLAAVSIGAPGRITAPDLHSPWPAGVSNIREVFSLPNVPDFNQMARVPVQYIVGEKDLGTKLVESMKNPTKFETEAGETRVERIEWLKKAWERVGILNTELVLVPDVGHDGVRCLPALEKWLQSLL
jgi:pimeloyl-ACP methyl ester carboxylesterase